MGASAQVFRQLCIMLLYMLAGYILYTKKILTEAGSKELASMLVKLIIPAVIVNSFCTEYTSEKAQKLVLSALAAALLLGASIMISWIAFPHKPIEQFSAAFSNPGFIGLPLIQSMLGSDAAVLVVAFIAMLNILQASYGVCILREKQGEIEWKPLLLNPIVLGSAGGVLLFLSGLGAHIPDVVQTSLRGISALNSPLAMIVLGTYLAKENLYSLVKEPIAYLVCGVRQILVPVCSILLLYLLPADLTLKQTLLIAAACPVGANVAVYAQLYGKNYAYAGKIVVLSTLLATPIPPVKWIIPGLLPAGLAIFAGPSKAGKSWLTLWLCLQISQGKSVWGRDIEPRAVLYFSLEDTLGRLQERLYQLVDAEEDPERLILQTESHGIGQGLEEQIVSFIHTYPNISLVVIDTLQKVRKTEQNGSMYANDYKDIGALKELADKYGICILLVHHLRKQSSSDPYDQISGSTGIMGVADTTWLMHRQRMSKTATIRVIGRDMDEKMLHIREENCVWTLDEEENAEQLVAKAVPDYLWKVADYIDMVGKWQGTATELLVAANISDVKPNQFTRKMAHFARDVFGPRGIEYKYTRTEQKRLFEFYHDDDDGDDDEIDIPQSSAGGIPQTSSSSSASSLRSLEGSKHGRSVATGNPPPNLTGPAPNPCEVVGA